MAHMGPMGLVRIGLSAVSFPIFAVPSADNACYDLGLQFGPFLPQPSLSCLGVHARPVDTTHAGVPKNPDELVTGAAFSAWLVG